MSVIVCSKDRSTGTPADFRLKLSQRMCGTYQLDHAAVSNTVYTIHAGHCEFAFSYAGTNYIAVLAFGFYDAGGITGALLAAMTAAVGGPLAMTIYYASVEGKLCISREAMVDLTILGGDPPPNSCMASLGFTRNKTSATPEIWADRLLDLAANSLCYHILLNDACSITNASTGSHSSLVLWNTQVNSMGLWEYTAEHFTQKIVLRTPVKELVVRIVDHNFQPLPVLGEWSIVLRHVC
jgi:hypothetical protein